VSDDDEREYPLIEHKGRMIEDHTDPDQEAADERRRAWEEAHKSEEP
jgi:hypothetical protein